MKRLLPIAFLCQGLSLTLGLSTAGTGSTLRAQTPGIRSVYVLPMAGGLDQYLAGWITREKFLQVTADAAAADLVLTDKLGKQLEQKLVELHPKEDEEDVDPAAPRYRGGSSRGSLFLVDAKTRNVIWSDFQKPDSNASAAKLNREAHRLAKNLQMSVAPAAKKN